MMRKTLVLAVAAGALALTPAVQAAPLVNVYAGAFTWNADVSGFVDTDGDRVDMEDDLGFDRSRQNVLYFGLEHFVPLVPNVRLRHMALSDSGRATTAGFVFDGQAFAGDVRSSFDLDMTDLTLYYTPLDNVVKLDAGLNVRRIDAEFDVRTEPAAIQGNETARETFPMLHLGARVNLPFSGFYAGGEINTIRYDGSRIEDYTARVGWVSDFLLGVELGYSHFNIKLDDISGLDADLEFGGPYLALSVSF